ncbi:hypothetical protein J2S43_005037 [Catenuloplanes nepalensis]|uniref:Uncharacterized protein n=1 Tax=Catenuloplanes nepalensis TaxID=587533 RepID=A0ABT9MYM2_9ACTN|nr:hypothetical protein [Catenuloplanes nepalensis]MDP9796525.1 hypothetical protein [Catenuloplanes nepalensis]
MHGAMFGVTFVLASVSATVFLLLRCKGKGRPFGPSARRWALAVIGVTSVLSTGTAALAVLIVSQLPAALLGLGVAAPSMLWLSELSKRAADRRDLRRDLSSVWLTRLLTRLQEGMADDRQNWCEERVDDEWSSDELSMAARYYHEYLMERLTVEERRRGRIHAQLNAIQSRLDVVHLIEASASRAKVVAALQGSRITKEPRYAKAADDLGRMAGILRHDAYRDLIRLLGLAYNAGHHKMAPYRPPMVLSPARSPRVRTA